MLKNFKILNLIIILFILPFSSMADSHDFNEWVEDFKKKAIKKGISKEVVEDVMSDAKFLPNVIKYDRYQPEFYEDTFTYIKKRTNKKKVIKGILLYKREKTTIDQIEKKFSIEKELLLALMGIETNFGKYLGKMDIISSLATLSFDKRRSDFFTSELMILLRLIDIGTVEKNILFGSWAGAFGNFQFMPRTIKDYAIDYNKNKIIDLKGTEDSFASAANYLSKIGWNINEPCFTRIDLDKNIPKIYLNSSAKKLKNKKKVKFFKSFIKSSSDLKVDDNLLSAIITPDKDIIPGAKTYTPAFLVYGNYEKILKWNRSLRFALAVCTLKEFFENEI